MPVLDWSRSRAGDELFAWREGVNEYQLREPAGQTSLSSIDYNTTLQDDLDTISRCWDPEAAQRLGERLRRFLEATAGGRAALAAAQRGEALTLRASAGELLGLPWGLCLAGPGGQRLLDLGERAPALAWPGVTPPAPRGGAGGARALFAWCEAGGPLPWRGHQEALEEAWAAAGLCFDPARDAAPIRSREQLYEALSTGEPPAVLHLLTHGGAGGLALAEGALGPDQLAALLGPHRETLRLVVLAVCRGADDGGPSRTLGSLATMLHRAGVARVIAARAPLSAEGSTRLAAGLYRGLLDEARDLDRALHEAAAALDPADRYALTLHAAPDTPADQRPVAIRPYRGLLAFQPADARLFFGREAEVRAAREALATLRERGRPRLLFITGASGSGKSSVALAGLIGRGGADPVEEAAALARLREDLDRLCRRLPDPALAEAARLLERVRPRGEAAVLRPGPGLAGALARASGGRRLLVLDQLEELFTALPAEERQPTVDALLALATEGEAEVVATLRVDLIGRLAELRGPDGRGLDRLAMDARHQLYVAAPDEDALREMIEGPARRVGLEPEPGLVERLLAELHGEPGALPLLSQLLDALWLRREGHRLTLAALDGLGGVRGALARHAEEALAGLDPEAARGLLLSLVEPGREGGPDLRRRTRMTELTGGGDEAATRELIERLVAARLLVRGERGGEPTLELAHEALIHGWPRLAGWLEEERSFTTGLRELQRWAEDWRAHGALLDGARLAWAEELALRAPRALPLEVADLLSRSRAALEAARAREAAQATALAEEARRARDARRMAEAGQPALDSLDRARRLLEVEDVDAAPGWAQAALELLCAPRVVARYGDELHQVTHARLGPGGIWLGYWDGRIVRVADDGEETEIRAGHGGWGVGRGGELRALAVHPASGAVAALLRAGVLWTASGGRRLQGEPRELAWLPDGRLRAVVGERSLLDLDAATLQSTAERPLPAGEHRGLGRDGQQILLRRDRVLHAWDLARSLSLPLGRVGQQGAALDAGGRRLLCADGDALALHLVADRPASALPPLRFTQAPPGEVRDLDLRGDRALSVHAGGVAARWALAPTLRRGWRLGERGLQLAQVAGSRVRAREQDGRIWTLDLRSGEIQGPAEGPPMHRRDEQGLEWTLIAERARDGLEAWAAPGQVELRDAAGRPLGKIHAWADCCAFRADGRLVHGAGRRVRDAEGHGVFLLAGPDGPEPTPLPGHEGASNLAFDAHGGVLSSRGSTLTLDRPGWPRLCLEVPEGQVLSLGLDGGAVVAGCSDGLLWSWELPETVAGLRALLAADRQAN